jgi:hypothetical protein
MSEIRGHEPDRARVAQVRVEHERGDRRGSGYRVNDIVVLTAAHVVEGASAVRVVFNADLTDEWSTTANVALCGSNSDVALLELNQPDGHEPVPAAQFGRLDRQDADVFHCRAIGFPAFHQHSWAKAGPRRAAPGPYRGVRQADGTIAPPSHRNGSALEFRVTRLESDTSPHAFPWEGMAGAAIWCADQIVGVVSSHQYTDGRNRVTATDVASWYAGLERDRLVVELTEVLGLPSRIDDVPAIPPEHAGITKSAEYVAVPARRHRILDVERERAIARWYVRPPGWEEASRVLAETGILLLGAEPGTGARTAAISLLGGFQQDSEPIHELGPQRDGPASMVLDPHDVVADERLLLDLSTVGGQQVRDLMAELPTFGKGVQVRGGLLVVVVPAGDEHLLAPELGPWTASVGRPDGGSVFEAHLHTHDVSGEYPNPPWPQLNVLLQRGTMAEIACLARTVRAAQDLAGERDLAYLIEAALTTRAEAGDEVAALVARQPNACFRSLLLASAMLEGRAVENVLAAQRELIRILDVATEIEHEFEKFDLAHRFRGVEAEVDGDATVRFPRLGYAEAVRRHFWSNYPGLRENLQRWVVECDSRIAGPGDVGDEFVRRFTDACFSARRPDDVVAAINSWALGSTAQVTLAASALAYGLEDARTRWWFHRQCERWASTRTLRPQIAELVIAACVGNIAPNHPGEAVVRLHQLCRNHDSRVVEAAGSALFSLADDRRALRRLLARLTTFPHGRIDHHKIDRDLFLAVARPTALAVGGDDTEALIADPGVRDDLIMGWRAILGLRRQTADEECVYEWFDAHTVDQGYRYLDVLIAACGGAFSRAATLRRMGRKWFNQRRSEDHRRTTQELDNRLYTFRSPR